MEDRVSSANLFNRKKPVSWLIAAALGAALFASGALVARATLDDEEPAAAPDSSGKLIAPGIGTDSVASTNRAAYGPNDVMTTGGRGADSTSFAGCRAPLPAGLISNGAIDPAKAGFTVAFPGSGFTPSSVSFSVQGECQPDGSATGGALVLDSSWRHDASGLDAFVSQRASTEKVASVFRLEGATFWANGYVFTVNVNPYRPVPVDVGGTAPATGSGAASSGSGSAAASDRPSRLPAAVQDERAAQVLRELVGHLAPGLDQKCFWTQSPGGWDSLSAVGVGDPRPAIPAGFTEADVNIVALVPPASGCDSSLRPTDGFSLNANWQKNANNSEFAYLGVSVYGNGGAQGFPGQLNDYGANWTNGSLSFSVYAKSEKPIGLEVVRNIAKAVDPAFNDACFIKERELTEAELGGLGLRAAKAPSGYSLTRSNLRAQEIGAGCPAPEGFQASYNLNWSFQKGADTIEASANRYGGSTKGEIGGYQSSNNLSWTSADGTSFYVNGYSSGVSPNVSKDDLIAVAKSMDPSFDISKLSEGGPDKPIAQPAPAIDSKR